MPMPLEPEKDKSDNKTSTKSSKPKRATKPKQKIPKPIVDSSVSITETTQTLLSEESQQIVTPTFPTSFWKSVNPKQVFALIGAVIGIIGLVTTAFQLAGIISMETSHYLIIFAWLVGAGYICALVFTFDYLEAKATKYKISFILISLFVLGIFGVLADNWMVKKRAELDKKAAQQTSEPDKAEPSITLSRAVLEEPLSSNKFPVARFVFTNKGQKSAENVRISLKGRYTLEPKQIEQLRKGILPKIPDKNDIQSVGVLGVNDSVTATFPSNYPSEQDQEKLSDAKKKLKEGKEAIFVWGELYYTNADGKKFGIEFCGFIDNEKDTDFTICASHNRIMRL